MRFWPCSLIDSEVQTFLSKQTETLYLNLFMDLIRSSILLNISLCLYMPLNALKFTPRFLFIDFFLNGILRDSRGFNIRSMQVNLLSGLTFFILKQSLGFKLNSRAS